MGLLRLVRPLSGRGKVGRMFPETIPSNCMEAARNPCSLSPEQVGSSCSTPPPPHTHTAGADSVASLLLLPQPGVLQILLPELLALAAQHGGPAPPQPPDAEPEEPRCQLEGLAGPGGLWRPRLAGQQLPAASCPWRPGSWLPKDKGKS